MKFRTFCANLAVSYNIFKNNSKKLMPFLINIFLVKITHFCIIVLYVLKLISTYISRINILEMTTFVPKSWDKVINFSFIFFISYEI